MKLKELNQKLKDNRHVQHFLYFSVFLIIISAPTLVLMELYVLPVLQGMNLVTDYLSSKSDNIYLDIMQFDQDEYVNDKINEFNVMIKDGKSFETSFDIIMSDAEKTTEDGLKGLYSIIIYQFSPLITLYAVLFFHLYFWSKVAHKTCKFLKLDKPSSTHNKQMERKEK